MRVVCIDSDVDDATKQVSNWCSANTYPLVTTINTFEVVLLRGNRAVRIYLEQELVRTDVVFLSGSGHGLYDEFQGNDGLAVLEKNEYAPNEVAGKIIHLLSCNTAFQLGTDVVANGCKAFFGYDVPFTYHYEYIDYFMQPDHHLILAVLNGSSARDVHEIVIRKYNDAITSLEQKNADPYVIADMETDRDHFCSPSVHGSWGDLNSSLAPVA